MTFMSINTIIKRIFMILVFALTINSVYAQSDNNVAVVVGGSISITGSSLMSASTLLLPAIYNDFTGAVTSEDSSLVPSGRHGQDSSVIVTAVPKIPYTVVLGSPTFTINGYFYKGHSYIVDGVYNRTTDGRGIDRFEVRAEFDIEPAIATPGSFNGVAPITFIYGH